MMNEIERKAVELLREEFAKVGISEVSLDLPMDAACVRAIVRALAWQPIETCPIAALVAEQSARRTGSNPPPPAGGKPPPPPNPPAPADWSMTYAERKAAALKEAT